MEELVLSLLVWVRELSTELQSFCPDPLHVEQVQKVDELAHEMGIDLVAYQKLGGQSEGIGRPI